jgi:L-serine/L-threonine ammonia-lyase
LTNKIKEITESKTMAQLAPWLRKTPLIHSLPLSALAKARVLLKMETAHPTGSFKDRGMGHFLRQLQREGCTGVISSSGGNAGCAVANAARILGMVCHVVVPETTKPVVVEHIRSMGANVSVHGSNWNAADAEARRRLAAAPELGYAHPFDHPTIWDGHSSIVDEIAADIGGVGRGESSAAAASAARTPRAPDAIVVCVGGGGLLAGVYEGLARRGWRGVPVVAVETKGAASFARARGWSADLAAQKQSPPLDAIDSIATSLGALKVADGVLERAAAHGAPTHCVTVSDGAALDACRRFAADHRVLVEPACGAGLSVLYGGR